MLKWTRRMRISINQPAKLARNWSHMVAFVRHFEYSRSGGLAPGHVYFWWRRCFQIPSFSPSTLENSVFKKHRFQIAPLWRAFSNGSVFVDRFRRCSVDDSRIRSKTAPFSFKNGFVWTGPKEKFSLSPTHTNLSFPTRFWQPLVCRVNSALLTSWNKVKQEKLFHVCNFGHFTSWEFSNLNIVRLTFSSEKRKTVSNLLYSERLY